MHLEREGIFLGKLTSDMRYIRMSDIITIRFYRGYSLFLCSRNYLGTRAFA